MREWLLKYEVTDPVNTLQIDGDCIKKSHFNVILDFPYIRHELVSLKSGKPVIKTLPASKIPVYGRINNGIVKLSNLAHRLFEHGETINLSAFIFAQQLWGTDYPQKNIFNDIFLLESSANYITDNRSFIYKESNLKYIESASRNKAIDILMSYFDKLFKSGRPIAVLLSGGYDSRLNLSISLHFSKKYGNTVTAFHEFKNSEEFEIAKKVARIAKVPFYYKDRNSFINDNSDFFKKENIIYNNGTYRDNLLRWHKYLSWIEEKIPGCLIIGLGAEAHKGKFYELIKNPMKDTENQFGIKSHIIKKLLKELKITSYEKDCQKKFFKNLLSHSKNLKGKGKIDFVHYHTYIANGYGQRCHNLIQEFQMAFPFLEDDFLEMVFSLDESEKKNFKIVKILIKKLKPEIYEVPYTSANMKSLNKKRFIDDYVEILKKIIRIIYNPPIINKNRYKISNEDKNKIQLIGDSLSEITETLKMFLLNSEIEKSCIRIEYALQLFLYFRTMENKYNVKFKLE